MIKLLIVDDEAVIRQGLRQAVDWARHGIAIAGEAKSGSEALQKVRQLQPDIVISDIRMAEGDGFSLARALPQLQPRARMIMLSGYSDMEYMIEAIKRGVRDYLLKPAGSDQILESVLKLRDEILQERQNEQKTRTIETLMSENMDTLKALFLEELVSGKLDASQAAQRASALGVALSGPRYALVLLQAGEVGRWELVQLVSSQLQRYRPEILLREAGEIAIILNVERAPDDEEMDMLVAQLGKLIRPMSKPSIAVADALSDLWQALTACHSAQSRSIWFEGRRWLIARTDDIYADLPQSEVLLLERGIVQAVRGGRSTDLQQLIESLFQLLHSAKPDRAHFEDTMRGVGRSIQVFSENGELYQRLEALFQAPYTVASVRDAVFESLNSDYSRYGPQVKNALTHMSKHYAEDLSLADVAQALYISPSYLTRLLKNKTGKGFGEWLHIIRINKSKELLEHSDLHHYEIAEQVGYRSYKIFSEYFLKLVGCSARSYREGLAGRKA